ncbi:MAG: hypothetical protein N3F09_10770, partial [Bacteroidia bacterium]|nr:hypothetical protein [Bacteroidia bacterium]
MKKLSIFIILFALASLKLQSQENRYHNYGDSLAGFDENSAKQAAFQNGCFGKEFNVFMEFAKRNYIKAKYNLKSKPAIKESWPSIGNYSHFSVNVKTMQAPCVNEDFEASPAGPANSPNAVLGWTLSSGTNWGTGMSCTQQSCCPNSAPLATVIQGPYIDPYIGASYPIVSQFGNMGPVPSGNKFLRINDDLAGGKAQRLRQTFPVNSNNALFKLAFIAVVEDGTHSCCDQPGFTIKIYNLGSSPSNPNPTLITCPQFSVTTPGTACNTTVSGLSFITCPNNSWWKYNQWKHVSLDLTPYIGNNIMVEVTVLDCVYGGHGAYMYLDCECGPMDITGTGNNSPAGTPSINLPTCGANGATITAPSGLGPYQWWGPGLPGSLSIPSFTHQTIITNATGQVTLQMNPTGACTPIVKVINVTITPAPNLQLTTQQPNCSSSLTAINGTLTVGPTPMTATVSGPTGTLLPNVTGNNLTVNTTTSGPGVYTITIKDNLGCLITQTALINPPPSPVTFSVGAPGNDYTLTCLNSPITVTAATQSTAAHNYTWTSASGTLTGQSVNITQPGVWTVLGQNAVSGCSATVTFTIGQNFSAPTVAVNPTIVTVNCNTASPATFTGTSNQGPNVTTQWYFLNGGTLVPVGVPQGTINIYTLGSPGTYVFTSTNNLTGCSSSFTVQANTSIGMPQFTVTSPTNFTIGCASTSVTSMQVTSVITSPT